MPPGVHVDIPLQAYFRINTENMGQFERTLIIADEGSYIHYVEGCTAPIYKSDSLHSAVVEIVVKKNARVRYTTIQNWSNNVYNLVTKRATAAEGATMEWVDGNIGSKVTMKYPAIFLLGEHAKGETLSIAFAGEGQHQDAGAKMVHAAPHTSSSIISKSVARGGGRTSYRGLVQVLEGAHHSASTVRCDALLVDTISRSDTYPYVDVREDDVSMGHEATVSKVSEDQPVLPDVPRHGRGRGDGDDRARVRRAHRARACRWSTPSSLNRLIEPADGGRGRMTDTTTSTTTDPHDDTVQEHAVDLAAQAPSPVVLDNSASPGPGYGAAPGEHDPAGQHGLVEHAHGAGADVPLQSRAERPTSWDVAAFPAPTGREEEWRFTPIDLLHGLLEDVVAEGRMQATTSLPTGSSLTEISADEARALGAPEPADRAAALAARPEHGAVRLSVDAEAEAHRAGAADAARGRAPAGAGPRGRHRRPVQQGDRGARPHRPQRLHRACCRCSWPTAPTSPWSACSAGTTTPSTSRSTTPWWAATPASSTSS
ncbi:hypothetical protein GCM10025868_02360 [Angustibacter aerolatus]|uniref:SUF system FeS cluster assembly SufBD core domain-containing protein n=1 Tax=Angustibacter aerolatus TaxID=1162965 RepID=A0ABQ6J9X4_9ACTN|nr:hypothetical protein GCM10025868_02360 [Angustibacter aerolatus]